MKSKSSKIVYLDQNAWIDLAKIYYRKSSNSDKNLLPKILEASNSGTAVFPISLIHLSELPNSTKSQWRKELLSMMIEISKYYTVTPYWTKLREFEIKNLILRELDMPPINVRSYFVGKGFSYLLGKTPTIKSNSINPEILIEINKKLQMALNDPNLFIDLAVKFSNDGKKDRLAAVKKFEAIRKGLGQFRDNDYRRKVFLWQNIVATILPKLNSFLAEMNLPMSVGHKITEKILGNYDADILLSELPTALCEFTLMFQRDQQSSRSIQVNDIYDIWHLTLAIPYSDVVVTEKMWTTIAKNTKLDERCNTVILSSINDLMTYL